MVWEVLAGFAVGFIFGVFVAYILSSGDDEK